MELKPYRASELDRGHLTRIQESLLAWYAANRRPLPWRGRSDPYAILVAEVMLQQTGVDRVAPIYQQFLDQFPTFEALAQAPRSAVIRAWARLGYNRRAVYLHETAARVVREHAGQLPTHPAVLSALPGLGPYTVAAVLCFAFGQDVPTIDTNVRRVLSRLVFGSNLAHPREVALLASMALPSGKASAWNQALMDLGATYCTAARPKCDQCPLVSLCAAVPEDKLVNATRWRSQKVAENPEPYVGSRRYYRGRIVAYLRDLPANSRASLDEVLNAIKPGWVPSDKPWVEDLVKDLQGDGIVSLQSDEQSRWVSLDE